MSEESKRIVRHSSDDFSSTPKKRIQIHDDLKVVLVPSRHEYNAAGLKSVLWWNSNDFINFQQSAHSEILLLASCQNIDFKAARRKLYQPNQLDDNSTETFHGACSSITDSHSSDYFWEEMEPIGGDGDDDAVYDETEATEDDSLIPTLGYDIRRDSLTNIPTVCSPRSSLSQRSSSNLSTVRLNNSNSMKIFSSSKLDDEDVGLSLCVPLKEPFKINFEKTHRRISVAASNLHKVIASFVAWASAALLALIIIIGPEACANFLSTILR
jgi:hypothetical protein